MHLCEHTLRWLLLAVALTSVCTHAADSLHTAAALSEIAGDRQSAGRPFVLTGVVQRVTASGHLYVLDATGAAHIRAEKNLSTKNILPGDLLELRGKTHKRGLIFGAGQLESFRLLGKRPAPEPVDITAADFHSDRYENRLVRVTGLFSDVIDDESDPNYFFVELQVDDDAVFVPFTRQPEVREKALSLVGAQVSVVGIVRPRLPSRRTHVGNTLEVKGLGDFRILETPSVNPFAAPDMQTLDRRRPQDIDRASSRVAEGIVLCAWDESRFLMRTDDRSPVLVDLSAGPTPPVGERVIASGFPEPNLYHVNLSRARWEIRQKSKVSTRPPKDIVLTDLLSYEGERELFHPKYHGEVIRLRGRAAAPTLEKGLGRSFLLESGKGSVPVILGTDCTGVEAPASGAIVEVTGVCCVRSEQWRPYRQFPRLVGVDIILRTPQDLRILAQPPWWTPRRFMLATAVLTALLLAMFLWNRTLRFLVARRGHQLFREKVAHYEAALRVDERTKLAVELHDSLAQSLTGAFMELETAENLGKGASPDMLRHLKTAAATVKSCHGELRNCLWDLRNLSLDEPDLNVAIRKTLSPHVRGIDLAVRFNVPRTRLSDNTTHAILRIIRELVLNAVRHGKATSVQVAGCLDRECLSFSVRDNGCGFDPDDCPGVLQGHFGLEGIRERIGLLDGHLDIESAPGKGTKATVSIVLPLVSTHKRI